MENQNVNVESTPSIVTMERRDMKKITTKQKIVKIIVTTLAAIQFIIIQVITSFTLRNALKSPGTAPHNAPASIPPKKAISQTIIGATTVVGIESAKIKVTAVLTKYCPGAPILNNPVLKATATDKPVKIKGVALNNISPKLEGLNPNSSAPPSVLPVLNTPENINWTPSINDLKDNVTPFDGIRAIINKITLPINKPQTIDINDDAIDLTESFFHVFINHVVLPSAIAFLEERIIYVRNPPISNNWIKNHNHPGILFTILYVSFSTSHV